MSQNVTVQAFVKTCLEEARGAHSAAQVVALLAQAKEVDGLFDGLNDLSGYLRGRFEHLEKETKDPAARLTLGDVSARGKPYDDFARAEMSYAAARAAFERMFEASFNEPAGQRWRHFLSRVT